MRDRRSASSNAEGFTLVELLVVLTILAIVGSIVSLSMSRGLQADAQARDRIEAFESMQIAMERMSREIRAANHPTADHPLDYEDGITKSNTIQFMVRRDDDECHEFRYELEDASLVASQRSSADDCASFGIWTEVVLLRGVDLALNQGVFSYWDEEREPVAPDPDDVTDIAFVEISFVRSLVLDQRPVTVNTVVALRNR